MSFALHGTLVVLASVAVSHAPRTASADEEPAARLDLRATNILARGREAPLQLVEPAPIARHEVPAPEPNELVALDAPEPDPFDGDGGIATAAASGGATVADAERGRGNPDFARRVGRRGAPAAAAASGPGGGAQGDPAHAAPEPSIEPPRPLDAPAPEYPLFARRAGEEGDVRCRLHVDALGAVTRVEVLVSSGSPCLDEAARAQLSKWRFAPAHQGGRVCACEVEHVVTFRLVRSA